VVLYSVLQVAGPLCISPAGLKGLQTTEAVPALVALVIVYDLPVRTEWNLRFVAPKRAVIAMLDRGIPLRRNEHAFPAEVRTTIIIDSGESCAFHCYTALFPTASRSARFTATFDNCTL
jgi:hypothetical protein